MERFDRYWRQRGAAAVRAADHRVAADLAGDAPDRLAVAAGGAAGCRGGGGEQNPLHGLEVASAGTEFHRLERPQRAVVSGVAGGRDAGGGRRQAVAPKLINPAGCAFGARGHYLARDTACAFTLRSVARRSLGCAAGRAVFLECPSARTPPGCHAQLDCAQSDSAVAAGDLRTDFSVEPYAGVGRATGEWA